MVCDDHCCFISGRFVLTIIHHYPIISYNIQYVCQTTLKKYCVASLHSPGRWGSHQISLCFVQLLWIFQPGWLNKGRCRQCRGFLTTGSGLTMLTRESPASAGTFARSNASAPVSTSDADRSDSFRWLSHEPLHICPRIPRGLRGLETVHRQKSWLLIMSRPSRSIFAISGETSDRWSFDICRFSALKAPQLRLEVEATFTVNS